MKNLSEESLESALAEIRSFEQKNGRISTKTTKLLLPPHIVKFLISIGCDTQEKIYRLYDELIRDTKI